ncbi:MAG TPA: Uma2 family endonuclease [Chthonomonadaceae bacterium]|nr:Uma2 family endonuclease [Chthonomonadaceae bacterium]
MSLTTIRRPRLSTGVFTDEELDYYDSLGPDCFPEEEENRVGETDYHYLSIHTAFELLKRVYPDPSDVHIAANNFIYWDRNEKGLVVAPDLYVVKGAGRRIRGVYKTWEEGGRTPDVVFEFASDKTWQSDLSGKKDLYERALGVREYFLFDPVGGRYPVKLQGFRLAQGEYQPIPLMGDRLTSDQLGLDLLADGLYLRFFDPDCGELIPTTEEIEQLREKAEAAVEAETRARREAEAELARLRAELETLRGGTSR